MNEIHPIKAKIWLIIIRIFKIKEGEILPQYMRLIRFILFPIEMTKWLFNRKLAIFDFERDYVILSGRRYPRMLFDALRYNIGDSDYQKIIDSAEEIT